MKLFDYKFLILLGLTLVVYFIYREILDLKTKISTIENKVDKELAFKVNKNNKLNNQKNKELTLSNFDEPSANKELSANKGRSLNFQIPLPPPPKKQVFEEVGNIPKLVHNMEDSEDIENLNNSGEQVAIYSNDNDKTESYSIGESSLIESSDFNQDEIIEDSMEDIIPEIVTNSQNSESEQLLEKSDISTDSKKKTTLVKSEGDNDIKFEPTTKNLNDLSYSELMRYKLGELQCFAEECSIDTIKDNGKKKTKSGLSKDIVAHFSKNKLIST